MANSKKETLFTSRNLSMESSVSFGVTGREKSGLW